MGTLRTTDHLTQLNKLAHSTVKTKLSCLCVQGVQTNTAIRVDLVSVAGCGPKTCDDRPLASGARIHLFSKLAKWAPHTEHSNMQSLALVLLLALLLLALHDSASPSAGPLAYFIVALMLSAVAPAVHGQHQQQLAQLCDLYASTGGPEWSNATGWSAACSATGSVTDGSANPCNRTAVPCNANECPGGHDGWRGVTCDSGGDVIGM